MEIENVNMISTMPEEPLITAIKVTMYGGETLFRIFLRPSGGGKLSIHDIFMNEIQSIYMTDGFLTICFKYDSSFDVSYRIGSSATETFINLSE